MTEPSLIHHNLTAHGADDLLITSPHLPGLRGVDAETSRGKRTARLDLTQEEDRVTLKHLAGEADIFLQSYRLGALAAKGLGPQELAELKPGIIYANLCAWGWEGPWKGRRGVCDFNLFFFLNEEGGWN